ncbi:MAG: type II toxin-antitoxin system VapC family toxin [Candidatus Heimdallarchaeota archaeon]
MPFPTLDTRFFVELFGQKDPQQLRKLKDLAKIRSFVSVITLHELYKMFAETEGKAVAEHRVRLLQSTYTIVEVSVEIALSAARLRIHKKLPTADSLIGATALSKEKIVVSDDPHYELIPGLQIKWI